MTAEEGPLDADAFSFQSIGVKVLGVIRLELTIAFLCDGVCRVDTGHGAKQDGCVFDGPGHRNGRILCCGDRNDTAAAEQAHCWLYPYDPIDRGRGYYRPIGLRAYGYGAEACSHCRSGTGAGARRISIQPVRISCLAAA